MKRALVALTVIISTSALAVDLATAYRDALANDPTLAIAVATHKISKESAVPQALGNLLPSISASSGEGRSVTERSASSDAMLPPGFDPSVLFSSNEVKSRSYSVNLSQPLINVPRWFLLLAARKNSASADWVLIQAQQSLMHRVAQGYLAVLRAQELLESTLASEEAIGRQLEQAKQRFDVGLVAITDVLNATAAYDSAVVTRIEAISNQGINFESLRTITGVDYQELDRLSDDLPIENPNPSDENQWVNSALANNPMVQSAKLAFHAAKDNRRSQLASYLPTVNLSYGISHSENPDNIFGQESDTTSKGLNLSVQVFQGGRDWSQTRTALYQQQRAQAQLTQTELTVARDTRNLFRTVAKDVAQVNANLKAIQSRQSALEATETGYEVGTRNIVDVLLAQQQLYQAVYQYANARYTYIENGLRLKQQVGTLSEEDLMSISGYSDNSNPVTKIMSLSGN